MAASSSRGNRAHVVELDCGSTSMASLSASATQPIISEDGKGQGWRQVGHRAEPDPLPRSLAPDRVLDRLAGLQEAGEAGIHPRQRSGLAAQQAGIATADQHDHHRVGAGEMVRPQFGHSRRKPPARRSVAVPQLAQKPWRACQSSSDLAVASSPSS